MNEIINIGATGMQAQQTQVETIANNITNISTVAYKKSRVNFEDVMYRSQDVNALTSDAPMTRSKTLSLLGSGVGVSNITKYFQTGELKKTDNPFDLAINGNGFFEITLQDGSSAYTRAGNLKVLADGSLATSNGYILSPAIQIPSDAKDVQIAADGMVSIGLAGQTEREDLGQIELVRFTNPSGLNPIGDNLYLATENTGDVITGKPGEENFGLLAQGYLEASNVRLEEELTNLILAQRAFEMQAKIVQTGDEMASISNNLRR